MTKKIKQMMKKRTKGKNMIGKVKNFDIELRRFPTLKAETLYTRKYIGGKITKETTEENSNENGTTYTSTGYITTLDIDRDRDVIMPDGIDWSEYKKNNVVLHMHDYRELPVGMCTNLTQDKLGWKGTTTYHINEAKNSQGFKNWEYRKGGFPLGRSIGFAPTEYALNSKYGEEFEKGWKDAMKDWEKQYKVAYGKKPEGTPDIIYTKSIAFEYSDVTVPANPSCVGDDETKGIDLITISKGMDINGKISVNKLMELKLKSLKEDEINNNLDTVSEEEMKIKEMLEAQQETIETLKVELKVLTDDKENKTKEAELKLAEAEAKRLADEEAVKIAKEEDELNDDIDVDTFKSMVNGNIDELVVNAIKELNEKVLELQDSIARVTGSI